MKASNEKGAAVYGKKESYSMRYFEGNRCQWSVKPRAEAF